MYEDDNCRDIGEERNKATKVDTFKSDVANEDLNCDEQLDGKIQAAYENTNKHDSYLPSRRDVIIGAVGVGALLGVGGVSVLGNAGLIRPPGGQDLDKLISRCIRCNKCIEACKKRVIKPAHIESGIINLRTPVMNFKDGFCDYCEEDNEGVPLCQSYCPTHALSALIEAQAEDVILGKAAINTDWCLAYKLSGCRHCVDACPYDAMEVNSYGLVKVLDTACNGCGACEAVCISLKGGSITAGATSRAVTVRALSDYEQLIATDPVYSKAIYDESADKVDSAAGLNSKEESHEN